MFYNQTEYSVQNWNSSDTSETIVEYNSFLSTDRIAVVVKPGYSNSEMIALNNYWGTTDTQTIQSMIYDRNDDLNCASYISYDPFLTEPPPSTPDPTPYLP